MHLKPMPLMASQADHIGFGLHLIPGSMRREPGGHWVTKSELQLSNAQKQGACLYLALLSRMLFYPSVKLVDLVLYGLFYVWVSTLCLLCSRLNSEDCCRKSMLEANICLHQVHVLPVGVPGSSHR